MKIEFPLQKKITLAALAILIGADATLAFFAMQSTRGLSRNELTAQKAQIKILKADIHRAVSTHRTAGRLVCKHAIAVIADVWDVI